MGADRYALGLDFGTNSVRALVVSLRDGSELATAVADYQRGEAGLITMPGNPHLVRQHPADYHEGMVAAVTEALQQARSVPGFDPADIIGLGVAGTGSTPIPVDRDGVPLAFDERFAENPHALAWLWKDDCAIAEAEQITALAEVHRPAYLSQSGGTYSAEWFWAKIWHCLNVAPEVFAAADSWVELCDYIPALLVGQIAPDRLKRSVCAAGHKAMYCADWGGLPDGEYLALLDPALAELRPWLYDRAHASDVCAGYLSSEWAHQLGLREGISVAVGGLDAHYGAVGSGVAEGTVVKIIGTSSCNLSVAPAAAVSGDIPGVCGIVEGSVVPGYLGIESGQGAVGDLFNWYVSLQCGGDDNLHEQLSREAAAWQPGQSGLLALDWNRGNRNVLVDARLTGLLVGQTLQTTRAEVYRALIEATGFGALTIHQRLREYGVPLRRIICGGGIAEKNALLMQIYADIFGQRLEVSRSAQTCALGAAIFGAVVAGAQAGGFATVTEAQQVMTAVKAQCYEPDPARQAVYAKLYKLYCQLHDSFGVSGTQADLTGIMKQLLLIKQQASSQASGGW